MARVASIFMLLLLAIMATGCASAREVHETRLTTVMESRGSRYEPAGEAVAASALAFAPAVAMNQPELDLDRSRRQPGAFFGYVDSNVETYSLSVDDRQVLSGVVGGYGPWRGGWGRGNSSGWYDRYERRAVSERVGTIRR